MVSSAFARARSTLPLTGCSSLFSLSLAFLRSRLFNSVSANRFAHLSSNANSTLSSSSSFSFSFSSSSLLLLKNTIDFALKFSFSFSLLPCILLILLLSGGGQDTNVSQEREESDDNKKGCRWCRETPTFGGPRKRISADGGGSSHVGIARGSKSFGRRRHASSSSSTIVVVYRRLSSHQKISIVVTQHVNVKDEKKSSDVALLFSSKP